ncbi:SDR family NAD(P)-dependent oxidoreductase [Candidatus Saccharibacteria bacterium]|nr:SDR family NAD(P)-dependent oxidoreductase [Candidatus Saccharibacteria bacterium]
MNVLIVGGTSGLGHELTKKFAEKGDSVTYTGRKPKDKSFQRFEYLPIDLGTSEQHIGRLVMKLPEIDTFVFAAGYYQEGRIDELSTAQIRQMMEVGGMALMVAMHELLKKQQALGELITITSTSQWTPRQAEPVYNFVKAGEAMFSNAMAEDGRVDKVLVAAPSGMKTAFWNGVERDDLDKMLDPAVVAEEIMKAREDEYRYKEIRILRQPLRVEEVEKR